jgi:hypothetical protein
MSDDDVETLHDFLLDKSFDHPESQFGRVTIYDHWTRPFPTDACHIL